MPNSRGGKHQTGKKIDSASGTIGVIEMSAWEGMVALSIRNHHTLQRLQMKLRKGH